MATVRIVARKSKRRGGTLPLYLRISHKGKERMMSLSERIEEKHWNRRREEARKSHPHFSKLNTFLSRRRALAEEVVMELKGEGREPRAAAVKERVEERLARARGEEGGGDKAGPDVFAYARAELEQIKEQQALGTWRNNRSAINKLRAFHDARAGGGRLAWEDLTPAYLERFMGYLASEVGNAVNTINKNMRVVRKIVRRAMRDGHLSREDYPFEHLTLRRERASKEPLPREAIRRIAALELPDPRAGRHPFITWTRDAFLFATYEMGMRWSDVCALEWSQLRAEDGKPLARLRYQMQKTSEAQVVRVVPPAREVLQRYTWRREESRWVFPFLDLYERKEVDLADPDELKRCIDSRNTRANGKLTEIGRRAGVQQHLTTHVARHSFASIAVEAGWTVREIQRSLGHRSSQTTERYLKDLLGEQLDEKLEGLW